MYVLTNKLKEVFFAVLPVVILVTILKFFIVPIENSFYFRFLIGSVLVVAGLTVFLIGVDIGITPFGSLSGTTLTKTNKLWIVLIAGLVFGFFISIAEPGLMVLANQVDYVTSGEIPGIAILVVVSLGLAILIALGFLRIFHNIPLYKILLVLYVLIFILSLFTSREFLAIAFDASGATTGILAVPFILSLSIGISKLKKDSKASEKDSFGLVAIASTGAIISVILLSYFSKSNSFSASLEVDVTGEPGLILPFLSILPKHLKESFLAILPLLAILIILQINFFKLSARDLRKITTGFLYAFLGLFLFLIGVNGGFMDTGIKIGTHLAGMENKIYIIIISFILGFVTILAEPAVYVLTHQIEDVTSGYIKRKSVSIPLAIGVGFAIMLSIIRILVPSIQLWHYLLPGYVISLLLMFFSPKLFVGIAFDAGGVATGPMTATFILAFIQGAAQTFEGADLMVDGFGMIAMVAMTPIITLEILGILYKIKSKPGGVK